MAWNNSLRATSDYWRRVTGRRILPAHKSGDPRSVSLTPLDPPGSERNGGVVESLRRARAWARK